MTTDDMKAFVRQHFEDFVNRQDLGAADRILHPPLSIMMGPSIGPSALTKTRR